MNKLIFTTNPRLYTIGWSIRHGKITNYLPLAQNWNLPANLRHNLFLNQQSQPSYIVMQKEIDHLVFVQGVHFEFQDSLINNGTKCIC